MGYQETPCAICQVSPKINRRRTEYEPLSAAWEPGDCDPGGGDCLQRGCKLVKWRAEHDCGIPSQTSNEVETFEDILPHGVDAEGNEVSLETYLTSNLGDNEDTWCLIEEVRYGEHDDEVEAYLSRYRSKFGDVWTPGKDSNICYEHVAGPNCVEHHGYDGNAISVEEMKYCTTVQCIVPYGGSYHDSAEEWYPEADDEEFERTSKYHLSGLGFRSATIEEVDHVYPRRHGCFEINPVDTQGFTWGHASFHPYCLETYRRVSLLRLGKIDLLDLAEWIERQDSSAPLHPAVRRGRSQWWEYTPGDEFLVSDPLRIPALSSLFEAAHRPQQEFDARSSPFGEGIADSTHTPDVLGKLPGELRDMVLIQLSSKDIANLRLASRTFRRLFYTTWHDLLKKEMPWVWEARTDRPYLLMSCATQAELVAHDDAIQARRQAATGLSIEQKALEEKLIAQDDADFRKPRPVQQLDRLHTDWHFLYNQLRREWGNIRGLQNRERIWKATEFVVRRIAHQDEPLDTSKQEHLKAYPYRDPNPFYRDQPRGPMWDEPYDPYQHFLNLERMKRNYSDGERSGENRGEESGDDSGHSSGEDSAEDSGEGSGENGGEDM